MNNKIVRYKVPDGKLLEVKKEIRDRTIRYIKITGDFFMYPESGIRILEDGLIGIRVEQLNDVITDIIKYC